MDNNKNTQNTIRILQNFLDSNFIHQVLNQTLIQNGIIRRSLIVEYFPIVAQIDEITTKTEVNAFITLLKALINVLKVTIQEEEWDLVDISLKMFTQLSASDEPYLTGDLVKQLIQLIHSIIKTSHNNTTSNDIPFPLIASCYTAMIEYKPKLVLKSNLLLTTIQILFDRLGKEPFAIFGGFSYVENLPEEKDPIRKAIMDRCRAYFNIIDGITKAFPHQVNDVTIQLILDGFHSKEYSKQLSAIIVAAASVEGLMDVYSELIEEMIPIFLSFLKSNQKHHSHFTKEQQLSLREITVYTLGLFAIYVRNALMSYSKIFIPIMIEIMNDSVVLQATTSFFFDNFLEHVHPIEMKHYLPSFMPQVILFFHQITDKSFVIYEPCSSSPSFNRSLLLHTAFRTLSAVVLGAEKHILQYQSQVLDLLKPFLQNSNEANNLNVEDADEIRGSAIDTLSHVILMSGSSKIDPEIIELGAQAALNLFNCKNEKRRENTFVFFANLVQENAALQKQIKTKSDDTNLLRDYEKNQLILQTYSPLFIPKAFEVLSKGFFNPNDDVEDEDESEAAMQGLIDVKIIALRLLSITALQLGKEFLPYKTKADECLSHYCRASNSFLYSSSEPSNVIVECIPLVYSMIHVECSAHQVSKPEKMSDKIELSPDLQKAIRLYFNPFLLPILQEENESTEMPMKVFSEFTTICEMYGRSMLELFMKNIYELALLYLNKLAPCQQKDSGDDGEEEDDDDDNSNVDKQEEEDAPGDDEELTSEDLILQFIGDFIATSARILGDDVKPYFDNFHGILLKYLLPSSHSSRGLQAAVIGCYAAIIEFVSPSIAEKYIPAILPYLQEGIRKQSHPSLRRNSSFTIGMIVERLEKYESRIPEFINWFDGFLRITNDNHGEGEDDDMDGDDDEEENPEIELTLHSTGADMDNALSTIARIITKTFLSPLSSNDVAGIDLKALVNMIFRTLPLKEDQDEGLIIYQMLSDLVLVKKHPIFFENDESDSSSPSLLLEWIRCLTNALHPISRAAEGTKKICYEALVTFCKLGKKEREMMEEFCNNLEEEVREQESVMMESKEGDGEEGEGGDLVGTTSFEIEDEKAHVTNLRTLFKLH